MTRRLKVGRTTTPALVSAQWTDRSRDENGPHSCRGRPNYSQPREVLVPTWNEYKVKLAAHAHCLREWMTTHGICSDTTE